MNTEKLNELAENHARKILGEEQFKNNKDAVKSISEDFKAGFESARILFEGKAKKWDELDEIVSKFYDEDEGNQVEDGLISIGEACAHKFGYL